MIVIVMGVAGAGKSTIGRVLADRLGWPFLDGDDYHSEANRTKLSSGIALTDEDRAAWLDDISAEMQHFDESANSAVIACSALKASYRHRLVHSAREVRFVYLCGDYEVIRARLESRRGHYMNPALLKNQFDILEEPAEAIRAGIEASAEQIVDSIIHELGRN